MKRLGDDVYDSPPIKLSFGSSHGESYDQSQVSENGLGRRGGGSRRDGAGASASKPKLATNNAMSYLKEVKDMFPDQREKYYMFLDAMMDFKRQRIDIAGVIERVKKLFKGHPSLILGLNPFLPNGYEIILSDEDKAPLKKTIYVEQEISLVKKIKECVGNEHECKSLLDINIVNSVDTSTSMDVKKEVTSDIHIGKSRQSTRSVIPPKRLDNYF